jgi:hypothetical protein
MRHKFIHDPSMPPNTCIGWQEGDTIVRQSNYTEPPLWGLKRLRIPKDQWEVELKKWRENLDSPEIAANNPPGGGK